jgi:6-phosphogluconolactonase
VVEPELHIVTGPALAGTAAELVATLITEAVRERGRCRFGLAGGSTPQPVYEQLAGRLPWQAIDWYWGDERMVEPDDAASNYAMVQRCLFGGVDAPPENIHRIHGELATDAAVRAYTELLGDQPLDVLLLGMGGDGHTASLFPDTPALANTEARVIATTSPVAPFGRITLGLRAINETRVVVLLVAGAGKATRLAEVHRQITSGVPLLPAALVQPTHGRLIWLIDTDAAEKLEKSQ